MPQVQPEKEKEKEKKGERERDSLGLIERRARRVFFKEALRKVGEY